MTQEEKELLLQDICGRLPYGVTVQYKQKTFNPDDEYTIDVKIEIDNMLHHRLKLLDFKPYLRPLSSMTEKEREEYRKFSYYGAAGYRNNDYKEMVATPSFEKMDFLNAHHFDYRGLIEKGLALKTPEDMYKAE